MSTPKKVCASCGEEYSGTCKCQKNYSSGWDKKKCVVCDARAFQPLNGKVLCSTCYFKEYEATYPMRATPEQIARFLILAGSKSVFWEKASAGMKQYTLNFYKTNKKDIDDYMNKIRSDETLGGLIIGK